MQVTSNFDEELYSTSLKVFKFLAEYTISIAQGDEIKESRAIINRILYLENDLPAGRTPRKDLKENARYVIATSENGQLIGAGLLCLNPDIEMIQQSGIDALLRVGYEAKGMQVTDEEIIESIAMTRGVAVDPEYRRHGIGSALVEAREEIARQYGKETLISWVRLPGSYLMYHDRGYRPLGGITEKDGIKRVFVFNDLSNRITRPELTPGENFYIQE